MKSHLISPATQLSHRTTRSSRPILLATFAVAATLLLTSTNRAAAQAQDAAAAQPSVATAQPSVPTPTAAPIPAPRPVQQEAQLINPFNDTRLELRPDGSQGNALTASPAQSPHHGLAKTGAIVGTIVLGLGVGAFALAAGHCNNYNSGPCSAFHYGGIGAMAGGGALAATGFYFTFRK